MGQSFSSFVHDDHTGLGKRVPLPERTHGHPRRRKPSRSRTRDEYTGPPPRSTPRTRISAYQEERPRKHRNRDERSRPLREVDGNTRQAARPTSIYDDETQEYYISPPKARRDEAVSRHQQNRKARPRHTETAIETLAKPRTRPRKPHPPSHFTPSTSRRHTSRSRSNTTPKARSVSGSKSRSGVRVSVRELRPPRPREREKKDCLVCTESLSVRHFPQRPPTAQCEHEVNTCKACLRNWIAEEFKGKIWDRLSCPECRERLEYEDVREWAPKEVFGRYERLSTRAAMESIPGFRWCIAKGCKSGQVHEGTMTPRFRCQACRGSHCVVHNVVWHKRETCAQYDYRTNSAIRKAEESASRKLIKEMAKKCPGCKWNIEKNMGCDHMSCTKCRHEFCWICLAPWGPIRNQGASMHRPTCTLYFVVEVLL